MTIKDRSDERKIGYLKTRKPLKSKHKVRLFSILGLLIIVVLIVLLLFSMNDEENKLSGLYGEMVFVILGFIGGYVSRKK